MFFCSFSILLPLLTTTLICVIVCGSVGSVNDNYFGKLKMQESLAQQDDRSLDSRLFNTGLFAIQSEIPIKIYKKDFIMLWKIAFLVNFIKKIHSPVVKGSTKSNDERLFDPNISTYLLNPQNCTVHQLIYDMFRNVIRNFLSHIRIFLKDYFSRYSL